MEIFKEIPPRWEDRSEDDWLAYANAVKRKVYDQRFEFPREWPFYLGWNAQHSNAPGTTCFLPVVDNTRQYINVLLILLSEPKGTAPLFMDDWRPFRPKGAADWIAWAASKVGAVDPIPYQPIGGIKRVRGGLVTPDTPGAHRQPRNGAHRPRGVLPDAEPHAAGRGAAPRRLGPRRADDPPRDAPRSGEGLPRPRLPRAQHQAGDVALQALAAGPRLAAELRRDRRRAGGPVPAVRHRHGRGRRPGHRGEVRAGRRLRRPARSSGRPTRTRRAPRATCATPPTTRPRRSSTPRRSAATSSRPTGASRRTPTRSTSRAPGCSSPTWRSSTTSASATPSTRGGRPRAGRSGGAIDEHAGPDRHRPERRGDAGGAAGQRASAG